jgi:5-hydroxyisourate hydrolase
MGHLTTHVLDLSAGLPAAGLRIELHELAPPEAGPLAVPVTVPAPGPAPVPPRLLASISTGTDGRCPAPLLAGPEFRAGRYALTYYLADYFRARGLDLPVPAFIEDAVIRIGIALPEQHYHVPLLVTPWSYSVYRGG